MRVNADLFSNALDAPERQVPLSALKAAHVGAVDADHVGETSIEEPRLEVM